MTHYLALTAVVMVVGLIPVFGPPSLVFAIFFYHKYGLSFVLVVLITALATTIGRLALALVTRRYKGKLPAKYLENLDYSKKVLLAKQNATKFGLGLFMLSPFPSAQLFEAAGLLEVRLLPLGLAFFIGRIITLSIYLALAHFTLTNFNNLWESGFGSWWAVLFEMLAVLSLIAMLHLRQIVQRFSRKR